MKEQELLFLGLLQEGPKHGYQLKKLMQDITKNFSGFKTNSIYYPLKRMLKDGLLTQEEAREEKRPKKYIYKITPKGKDEFKRLLLKNILTIERPYFSIDLSLYFLNYIPASVGKHYLMVRLKLLNRLKKALLRLKSSVRRHSSASQLVILEHNQQLLGAEIKFISNLTANNI